MERLIIIGVMETENNGNQEQHVADEHIRDEKKMKHRFGYLVFSAVAASAATAYVAPRLTRGVYRMSHRSDPWE